MAKRKLTKEEYNNTPEDGVEKNPVTLKAKGLADRALYIQWLAIPTMLRSLPDDQVEKMGYPTDDIVFMKLLRAKRKKYFCEEFGVSVNMPAIWEKEPDFFTELNQVSQNSHVMKFRKDVDFAFTHKTMKHGDAARMKLWKQLYEGWSERTESVNVNLNLSPADLVKEIEARNKKIRDIPEKE